MSLFGNDERYWLGRMDGTDYVFDVPLRTDFAEAILAASPQKYVLNKTPRAFPGQTVNGTEYAFVEAAITYDKPQYDKGQIALARKPGTNEMLWIDAHLESAAGKPLTQQLPVPKQGEWKSHDLVILLAPDAEEPDVRMPIPVTNLAKTKMIELGQQTTAGIYYPTVKIPADLSAFQEQMLAYGNAGRQDPYFRQDNGAKTATDLGGTKTVTGGEEIFKQSETPPYFADHVLNEELNAAAQFQAEYQAYRNKMGHDGPAAFLDPKTGKNVDLSTLGKRADFFGAPGLVAEAAGSGLGQQPHSWMASDTHFRPWFNVKSCVPAMGYGAAMAADGTWYFAAVPHVDDKCLNPGPAAQPKPPITATTSSGARAATAQPADASPCMDPSNGVSEAASYTLVYHLQMGENSNYGDDPVPYDVNNAAAVGDYTRVAYCLQLDGNWVWVSMDDFTNGDVTLAGVPVKSINPDGLQQAVANMTVASNLHGIVTGEAIETGNIEFWPHCYTERSQPQVAGASNIVFDFGDSKRAANNSCSGYGSMQIHNHGAQQTLLAYNAWNISNVDEIGIGNHTGSHPDWTFSTSAQDRVVRNLWIYVDGTPSSAADGSPAAEPVAEEETLLSLQSSNFPERFVRHTSYRGRIDPIASELEKKDSTFRQVPGLADDAHISLEAVNFPNYFLTVEGNTVMLRERPPGDAEFDKNATFIRHTGLKSNDPLSAEVSFESYAQRDKYVRHSGYVLFVKESDGSDTFKADATFVQTAPNYAGN